MKKTKLNIYLKIYSEINNKKIYNIRNIDITLNIYCNIQRPKE